MLKIQAIHPKQQVIKVNTIAVKNIPITIKPGKNVPRRLPYLKYMSFK
jgi:hypothetical protein